MEKDLGKG